MPKPNRARHRPSSSNVAAPLEPMVIWVREYESWRRSQNGKPGKAALRDYWRPRDLKQAQRPDYMLWRHTLASESLPEKRQSPVDLALHGLKSPDPIIQWAILSLTPNLLLKDTERREELVKAIETRIHATRHPLQHLPACLHSCDLVKWLNQALISEAPAELQPLHDLLSLVRPEWKPGRAASLDFVTSEGWLPVAQSQIAKWLAGVLECAIQKHLTKDVKNMPQAAAWHLTAWMLLRDARPANSLPREQELDTLLNAAATAQMTGETTEALRYTALALNLAPEKLREPTAQRCCVAAWALAEAGISAPPHARVRIDDLPFPGEPPASAKGLESARLFRDEQNGYWQMLDKEAQSDPDWQRLREAGIVLHHPLAALAWVGKKAQSYVVKKQYDILQTAASLALHYQCITTAGKILAQYPVSAATVLAYAEAMRQSLRNMPVLRDHEVWASWTDNLRAAWGRLDTDAILDEDQIFMLHELLVDREATLMRTLPEDLRLLALRHLHNRRPPSALVRSLEADTRQMQALARQRTVELWSLASGIRQRPGQDRALWVSLVTKGDTNSGKYSLLVQGPTGRVHEQGRLRDSQLIAQQISEAADKVGTEFDWVLLAVDSAWAKVGWIKLLKASGLTASVTYIPSWEWAFRVMRESTAANDAPELYLHLEGESAAVHDGSSLPNTCILNTGKQTVDAATRWFSPSDEGRAYRSLQVGACPTVVSLGPVMEAVELKDDLARLCLSQGTRVMLCPQRALTEQEVAELRRRLCQPDAIAPYAERLRQLDQAQPGLWKVKGLPWAFDTKVARQA